MPAQRAMPARLGLALSLLLLWASRCVVRGEAEDASAPHPAPEEAHVLIATPCYGGTLTDAYHLSVVASHQYYRRSETITLATAIVPGIADLPKARGALIAQFLSVPHYTHIFFVDADIEFQPHLIERFVASGHDVLAAMYPKKHIAWDRVRDTIAADARVGHGPLMALAHDYPVEWEFEKSQGMAGSGDVHTDPQGFARARRVGAGFLMASRTAIERLVAAHPELSYVDGKSGQTHHALFHTVFDGPVGGKMWVSEDFAFCDRWSAIGGEVWVDLKGGLTHVGPHRYEGEGWIARYMSGAVGGGDGGSGGRAGGARGGEL